MDEVVCVVLGVIYFLFVGSSGPLLRLLRHLVDLCPSSSSPSVAVSHVARVLGEIGPRDLACIALPAVKQGETQ